MLIIQRFGESTDFDTDVFFKTPTASVLIFWKDAGNKTTHNMLVDQLYRVKKYHAILHRYKTIYSTPLLDNTRQ